jgi:hypothetical protein
METGTGTGGCDQPGGAGAHGVQTIIIIGVHGEQAMGAAGKQGSHGQALDLLVSFGFGHD